MEFDDIGEYMQKFHIENNIKFVEGICSYFGKEMLFYTPILNKMVS